MNIRIKETKYLPVALLYVDYDVRHASTGDDNEDAVAMFEALYLQDPELVPALDVFADESGKFCVDEGRNRLHAAQRARVESIKCNILEPMSKKDRLLYVAWGGNEQKQGKPMTTKDRVYAAEEALMSGATPDEIREFLRERGLANRRIKAIVCDAETNLLNRKRARLGADIRKDGIVAVALREGMDADELANFMMPKRHRVASTKKQHGEFKGKANKFGRATRHVFDNIKRRLQDGEIDIAAACDSNTYFFNAIEKLYMDMKKQHEHTANFIKSYGKKPQAAPFSITMEKDKPVDMFATVRAI